LAYERKQNELAIDRLYAHQPASPINPNLDVALDLKLTRKDPSSGPTADHGATAAA